MKSGYSRNKLEPSLEKWGNILTNRKKKVVHQISNDNMENALHTKAISDTEENGEELTTANVKKITTQTTNTGYLQMFFTWLGNISVSAKAHDKKIDMLTVGTIQSNFDTPSKPIVPSNKKESPPSGGNSTQFAVSEGTANHVGVFKRPVPEDIVEFKKRQAEITDSQELRCWKRPYECSILATRSVKWSKLEYEKKKIDLDSPSYYRMVFDKRLLNDAVLDEAHIVAAVRLGTINYAIVAYCKVLLAKEIKDDEFWYLVDEHFPAVERLTLIKGCPIHAKRPKNDATVADLKNNNYWQEIPNGIIDYGPMWADFVFSKLIQPKPKLMTMCTGCWRGLLCGLQWYRDELDLQENFVDNLVAMHIPLSVISLYTAMHHTLEVSGYSKGVKELQSSIVPGKTYKDALVTKNITLTEQDVPFCIGSQGILHYRQGVIEHYINNSFPKNDQIDAIIAMEKYEQFAVAGTSSDIDYCQQNTVRYTRYKCNLQHNKVKNSGRIRPYNAVIALSILLSVLATACVVSAADTNPASSNKKLVCESLNSSSGITCTVINLIIIFIAFYLHHTNIAMCTYCDVQRLYCRYNEKRKKMSCM